MSEFEQIAEEISEEDRSMNRQQESLDSENGVVPADWDTVRFADSVNIKNGQVDPREAPFDAMLHVGSKNIESDSGRFLGLKTNQELQVSSGNYHFTPNDVLYSKIRPYLNKVALPEFEGTCSADMYPLRSDDFTREYLFFYLLSDVFKKAAISFQDRTGIPKINRAQLGSISLVRPPLLEQKKIAHILSTVQRAIEAQGRIIQTTTELKKALMHKLFTEGLRNEPQKQTQIGPVPESWAVVELESTGEVVYGIQASVANNLAPVGTRILTNKNITLNGGFDFEKINYFELITKRHRETILQQGDILFNWRSGSKYHVGKTAYFDLEGEWVHSSFILRIRPKTEVNCRFLFYYFNHLREEEYFAKLQTYAINAKFNKSAVNALPTVVPPREEQNDIARILDTAQLRVDSANRKHHALKDLFRILLHELMTGTIRVNELELGMKN